MAVPFMLFVGAVNYAVDPLRHFGASGLRTCFCEEQRYLNPGLAKHFDYDTILIGTSMTENFEPSYIDKRLGVRSLKLSIKGASAYEENLMMDTAIRTGKVKNVLFGVDVFSFVGDPGRLRYGEGSVPFYLYDDNILNDYRYLLNLNTFLNQSRHTVTANLLGKEDLLDIDKAFDWSGNARFSKQSVMKEWRLRGLKKKMDRTQAGFEILKRSFDYNVLPHIVKNREINFYIFFPPYSILTWKQMEENGLLEDAIRFNRYVYDSTKALGNVKVFNFQDEDKITFDLDNYMDLNHYSPSINRLMIDSMSAGGYLMTEANAGDRLARLASQARGYRAPD